MYVYKPYPRWKYHAEKEAVIVADETAEAALGKGWFDSPADVVKREEPAAKEQKKVSKKVKA